MIKNEDGEKCSPKDLANEILIKCLGRIEFWIEAHPETIMGMTERELGLLNDQVYKQAVRCFKVLGVKPDEIGTFDEINMPEESDVDTPTFGEASEDNSEGVPIVEECGSDDHNVEEYCPDCQSKPQPVTCLKCGTDLREPLQCDECSDLFA